MKSKVFEFSAYGGGVSLQFLSVFLVTELLSSERAASVLLFLTAVSICSILARAGAQPNILKFREYKLYFKERVQRFHINLGLLLSFFFSLSFVFIYKGGFFEFISFFGMCMCLVFFAIQSINYRVNDKVLKSLLYSKIIDKTMLCVVVIVVYLFALNDRFYEVLSVFFVAVLFFLCFRFRFYLFGDLSIPSRKFLYHCQSAVTINVLLIAFKNIDIFLMFEESKEFSLYIAANKYSEIFYAAVPFINIYFMKVFLGVKKTEKDELHSLLKSLVKFYAVSIFSCLFLGAVLFSFDLSVLLSDYLELRKFLVIFFFAKLTLIFISPFNLILLRTESMKVFTITLIMFLLLYIVSVFAFGTIYNAPLILAGIQILMFLSFIFIYVHFNKQTTI